MKITTTITRQGKATKVSATVEISGRYYPATMTDPEEFEDVTIVASSIDLSDDEHNQIVDHVHSILNNNQERQS